MCALPLPLRRLHPLSAEEWLLLDDQLSRRRVSQEGGGSGVPDCPTSRIRLSGPPFALRHLSLDIRGRKEPSFKGRRSRPLVQETAIGQRTTRAKAKIKAARIPYRVPLGRMSRAASPYSPSSTSSFNEGYLATGPDTDPVRHDVTAEAIRPTRLIRALMPDDGEVAGLARVMLLTEARRTARVSASGELVTPDRAEP